MRVDRPEDLPEVFRAVRVTGLESVVVTLNGGDPLPIDLASGRFDAPLDLVEGENVIVATAKSLDGQVQSDRVTVWVKPPQCGELVIEGVATTPASLDPGAPFAATNRATQIVYDSSGSMWGQINGRPKYLVARDAMKDVMGALAGAPNLSLRVYGDQSPRDQHDCADTRLLIGPGEVSSADDVEAKIAALRPRGQTPIAHVLEQAGKDLSAFEGERSIVLVTDGVESCGGDAVGVARRLHEELGIAVHVVGLGAEGAGPDTNRSGLEEIARNASGSFVTAETASHLREQVAHAIRETRFRVLDSGSVVMRGVVGSDPGATLAPGRYEVLIGESPPLNVHLDVHGGHRTTIVLSGERAPTSFEVFDEPTAAVECP